MSDNSVEEWEARGLGGDLSTWSEASGEAASGVARVTITGVGPGWDTSRESPSGRLGSLSSLK